MKSRDITLDILKGIGILAVIVGHLTTFGRQFIFSFHMPLFFLISGYLFSQKPLLKSLKNDFKRLIIPYLITASIIVLFYIIISLVKDKSIAMKWIIASIWGSGAIHSAPLLGDIPYIGAIWFLLALFWCKNIFLILVNKIKNIVILGIICLLITLLSSYLDNNVISLPFAILPGCGALFFYFAGYFMRIKDGFNKVSNTLAALLVGIWVLATFIPNRPFGMVTCDYTIWILTIPGAIAAAVVLYKISQKATNNVYLYKMGGVIAWLGECSLVILCIHLIDLDIPLRRIIGINSSILAILFDISLCLIGTVILTQFYTTRSILKIKKIHI